MTTLLVLQCNSHPGCLMKESSLKRIHIYAGTYFLLLGHPFHKYLTESSIIYMPGTVLGTRERDVNKIIYIHTYKTSSKIIKFSLSY